MANGYYERGEVYWCRIDSAVGSEMGLNRPAVVLSSTEENNKFDRVIIAYLTTKVHPGQVFVNTMATGRESQVIINQMYTVDKSRFGKCMGVLDRAEMRELNDALENYLDLGYDNTVALNAKDTEIAALRVEIARLEGELELARNTAESARVKLEDEVAEAKLEAVVQTKLYERCLDKLVKMRLGCDIKAAMRAEAAVDDVVKPVAVVAPVEEPEIEEPDEENGDGGLVDVNHCTATQLKKIGFSLPMAKVIINKRPYKSVDDLRSLPGMKASLFRLKAPMLCVVVDPEPVVVEEPVAPPVVEADPGYEKVNLNTCGGKDLIDIGMTASVAYKITSWRKHHGFFVSVAGIADIPGVSMKQVDKFGDMLEV